MARVATAEGRGESPEAGDRSARSRQAILAVAAGTIARHGIHGLRVERVAKEAGVSTALLYYHFGSRSGLVNAAFEYASELAPSTALRLASDEQSGYEAVAAALLAELDESPDVREFSVVWGDVSANAVFEPELRPSVRNIPGYRGQNGQRPCGSYSRRPAHCGRRRPYGRQWSNLSRLVRRRRHADSG